MGPMGPKGSQVKTKSFSLLDMCMSLTFRILIMSSRKQGDPGTTGDIGVKGDQVWEAHWFSKSCLEQPFCVIIS